LMANRNRLMTQVVGELQRILKALETTKEKSYPTTFRIADFAQFVLKVADAGGRQAQAEAMFEKLAQEQLAFTVQDDPVVELLEDWVKVSRGHEVTTAQLFAELRHIAQNASPPKPFDFRSSNSFGQYLQSHLGTLKVLFGATERTAGGRKRLWRFDPPMDIAEPGPVEVKARTEKEDIARLVREMEGWGGRLPARKVS
jgi:hypothetical protein